MSIAYGCEVQVAASPALASISTTRVSVVSQMQAQSFASRSPLASTQAEVNATVEKEWDRVLLTTLGVAGKRVYEMRVQSPSTTFQHNAVSDGIGTLLRAFNCPSPAVCNAMGEYVFQQQRADGWCYMTGYTEGYHQLVPMPGSGA